MSDHTQQTWLPPSAPGRPAPDPDVEPAAGPHPDPPEPPETRPESALKRTIGPLFLVVALLAKFGKGAFVVLKGAKFLTTSASMLVSVAAYALIWGWKFGVAFVALLFVHEMGHYVQLRREGVRPSGMLFIPFLGAVVGARSLGGNAVAEARVGLAGPVVGTLASLALIPVWLATGEVFWRALAFVGLLLNGFNLLPMMPLDGGRAMAVMNRWIWLGGLGAVAVLAFTFPSPVLILILLLGTFETYRRFKGRKHGEEGNEAYYRVTGRQRLAVGLVYLALIVVCGVGMDYTFVDRSDRF